MQTIKLMGHVDEHHRLSADAPALVPPGPVEIVVLLSPRPEEADAGAAWMAGVAREWAEDLGDARQDIYTLADGEPVNGAG
jgi:hypothetical protein